MIDFNYELSFLKPTSTQSPNRSISMTTEPTPSNDESPVKWWRPLESDSLLVLLVFGFGLEDLQVCTFLKFRFNKTIPSVCWPVCRRWTEPASWTSDPAPQKVCNYYSFHGVTWIKVSTNRAQQFANSPLTVHMGNDTRWMFLLNKFLILPAVVQMAVLITSPLLLTNTHSIAFNHTLIMMQFL